MTCEYFTRYGNGGTPGACISTAKLALVDSSVRPAIHVCGLHARVIVSRFPELGGIEKRFERI